MIVRLILRYNLGLKKEGSGDDDAEATFTQASGGRASYISRMRLGSHSLCGFGNVPTPHDGKPKLRIDVLAAYGPSVRPLT